MPTEIIASQPAAISQNAAPITPSQLLEIAVQRGASIEQMAQLFDLKLRVEADEAKKAFHDAFTAFKAETIRIVRDKENAQYSKPGRPAMYTSLENMVATVTPFLSKHGLSHHWDVTQGGAVSVSCVLTHTLGHSQAVTMTGPLDESGAKNKLQQIKSTVTYLKVSTFESVCGLASAFGSTNDDGNSASSAPGQGPHLPVEEYAEYMEAIEGARDVNSLQAAFKAAWKAAQTVGDTAALASFTKAKDATKKGIA